MKPELDDPNWLTKMWKKMWKWMFVQEGKNIMSQHILDALDELCRDKKIGEDALQVIVKAMANCTRNEVKKYEVFVRSADDKEIRK